MDIQNKLIEKINDGFLIAFANHLFDNYVKMGDYYHLKGEVYWNTSRKSIDELLIDYKKEYKDIENIKKIDISFESIFVDKEILSCFLEWCVLEDKDIYDAEARLQTSIEFLKHNDW